MTRRYHFIGIGGIGMSGLAKMLIQKGCYVSGSDLAPSYVTEALIRMGAVVSFGHDGKQVPDGAEVIYSTDIACDNPEMLAAKQKGCPLFHRSDLLLQLMQGYRVLSVTGTHGKTTTSALLAHVCITASLDPAVAVGGIIHNIQSNAHLGRGEYFVVEADESDGTFLKYPYEGAIVTNIDTDHLSHFGSWEGLVGAFDTFLKQAHRPEWLFYCHDDPTLVSLNPSGVSYGFSEGAQLQGSSFRQHGYKSLFDISFAGQHFADVELALTGQHNALNALAVFGLASSLGVDERSLRHAFSSFQGVKRRLEKKGESAQIVLFDDYAHHPTEIRATLKALRSAIGTKRLLAVFQPHRYSRMRYVLDEIGAAFDEADSVVITDLYTANEEPDGLVSTEAIFERISHHFARQCVYMPRQSLVESLVSLVQPGDVVITLGAGDITKVASQLAARLEALHG